MKVLLKTTSSVCCVNVNVAYYATHDNKDGLVIEQFDGTERFIPMTVAEADKKVHELFDTGKINLTSYGIVLFI